MQHCENGIQIKHSYPGVRVELAFQKLTHSIHGILLVECVQVGKYNEDQVDGLQRIGASGLLQRSGSLAGLAHHFAALDKLETLDLLADAVLVDLQVAGFQILYHPSARIAHHNLQHHFLDGLADSYSRLLGWGLLSLAKRYGHKAQNNRAKRTQDVFHSN